MFAGKVKNISFLRFKELSPLCPQAGFFLATSQYSNIVKHFGLQLIEYTIKFNWNNISQQEKVFIKVCMTIDLLSFYGTIIFSSNFFLYRRTQ